MLRFLEAECKGLYALIKANFSVAVVLATAALALSLDHYHPLSNEWLTDLVYLAVLPSCVILFVLRKNPLNFGLRLGKPRIWLPLVVVTCLVAALVLYLCSSMSSLQNYYNEDDFNVLKYGLVTAAALFGSEFFFRGFLIFGLKDKLKEASILIQMVPFVLVHIGKPEIETISTIFTGILFGYIVYRGKSIWPAYIIHMFINIFFVVMVNWRQ